MGKKKRTISAFFDFEFIIGANAVEVFFVVYEGKTVGRNAAKNSSAISNM